MHYSDRTLRQRCWTLSGRHFGYWEGDDLWSYHGHHVGRLRGADIFAPDGRYGAWLLGKPFLIVMGDTAFTHGGQAALGAITLFSSYHCSRYNTNTGVLTPQMFRAVFAAVREFLDR